MNIRVTEQMMKAGEDMADLLTDATCEKAFGGDSLGGCRAFDVSNYPEEYRELILEYIEGEPSSVKAIYSAMEMAK